MGEQRPFLAAVVDPEVAFYWAAELGPVIERVASRRSVRLRRKMLQTREQLREAGRQWAEGRLSSDGPAAVAEHVESMTVAEAAAVLDVSDVYVRRLCRRGADGGGLAASQQGRVWVIEAWSVHACLAERAELP